MLQTFTGGLIGFNEACDLTVKGDGNIVPVVVVRKVREVLVEQRDIFVVAVPRLCEPWCTIGIRNVV